MSTIWVIAPFDYEDPKTWQRVWENNIKKDFISIGWDWLGNVSKLTAEEIYQAHRKLSPKDSPRRASVDSKMLYKFWNSIKLGHTVVARRGRKSIAAIGKVTSDPYFSTAKTMKIFKPYEPYPNHIDVKWDTEPRDIMFAKQVFGMQTIHSISDAKLKALMSSDEHLGNDYPYEADEFDFTEGGPKKYLANRYERDPKARAACLKHHGYRCAACEMLFVEVYGEIGINFIHVHHLRPIASRKKSYKLDPKKDLVPVCPNCHAMIHRSNPPTSTDKLCR